MTFQSEVLGHFLHFFHNLEFFLSFSHFTSFASHLDFLINLCSNVTMDHIFLNYRSWHLIFAKIPILPFVQQMKFTLWNPNFWFWGMHSLGQLWTCEWTLGVLLSILNHILRYWLILRWKFPSWGLSRSKTLILYCWGSWGPKVLQIVQFFAWFLIIGLSWFLWLPWGIKDHVNLWLVLCLNVGGKP